METFLGKALQKGGNKLKDTVTKYTTQFTAETKELGQAMDWRTSIEPNMARLASDALKAK